jgi:hypothetical protein
MKIHRYSRWDGRQEEFSLDARRALDAVSDLLMEGLDVEEAWSGCATASSWPGCRCG